MALQCCVKEQQAYVRRLARKLQWGLFRGSGAKFLLAGGHWGFGGEALFAKIT